MRVKQTAKKITSVITNVVTTSDIGNDIENSEQNSCDNQNDISDIEVEFLVECRRDQEGNQFLLDGTLVIEPAEVDTSTDYKENPELTKEINFEQFVKEIEVKVPQSDCNAFNPVISIPQNEQSCSQQPHTYSTVKCTACNNKFGPFLGQTLFEHPLLKVILCSSCIQNQKDEFFVIDKEDNKETLCRWCVEGGSLICCDFCPKSFCKTCIKRNLGRHVLSAILNQDDSVQWRCFVCDPRPIQFLKIACSKVFADLDILTEKGCQKPAKKPISKLSDIVNKKRSISKAFPNDTSNGFSNSSAAKIATPQPTVKQNTSTETLLNSMANYGTEWYMRNINLRNILMEIDDISARTLLNAINSTKKCIESFYSDIRNLEMEISKASTASEIPTIVSMFKSVYRHHIFNRFCQVKNRIEDERNIKYVVHLPHNGGHDFNTSGIKNTNSIPSLVINNVVSTAPGVCKLNHFPSHNIGQSNKQNHSVVSNGDCRQHFMASIDLTDDSDKNDLQSTELSSNQHGNNNDTAKEVVDLCADEDSIIIAYPTVNFQLLPATMNDDNVAVNDNNEH